MGELPLEPKNVPTRGTYPRSMNEARVVLEEISRVDRPDNTMRRQASIARRILNEESQLEAERLYAVTRAIKSLRKMRAPR